MIDSMMREGRGKKGRRGRGGGGGGGGMARSESVCARLRCCHNFL